MGILESKFRFRLRALPWLPVSKPPPSWHQVLIGISDSIALHTSSSIALYKEDEVRVCCLGIGHDFIGPDKSPGGMLTRPVWETVLKEFPRVDFKNGVTEALCNLCRTKPETTYDNFVSDFGTAYVEGYSTVGTRLIDVIQSTE